MGAYEDHLRHVAEPQAPSEKEKAVSTTIEDHAALWLGEHLREFAHYGSHQPTHQEGIAAAYASYIDKKVRDLGQRYVTLYVHTEPAVETLIDALYYAADSVDPEEYPTVLHLDVANALGEMFLAFVDDGGQDNPGDPIVTNMDGTMTVVFDPDEAFESYAEMQTAKAESEAMKRHEEAAAEHAGVNNLPEDRRER